jgi:hypothetical protein
MLRRRRWWRILYPETYLKLWAKQSAKKCQATSTMSTSISLPIRTQVVLVTCRSTNGANGRWNRSQADAGHVKTNVKPGEKQASSARLWLSSRCQEGIRAAGRPKTGIGIKENIKLATSYLHTNRSDSVLINLEGSSYATVHSRRGYLQWTNINWANLVTNSSQKQYLNPHWNFESVKKFDGEVLADK